ncbi:MAG: hypothetical protein G3M78_12795 [Candidatus Nitrohelix vancouverensis]|uniref:DUF2946 domain-containing protein n=1 Tax=Candidatus Nitrohelix vancouverensis TaxID=2705534 RepID=A0A7T0C491_9BACT|nr:MAG: hypothetical protein G3M78_12795 [Candidatus Nitrohelix vancouverensis]
MKRLSKFASLFLLAWLLGYSSLAPDMHSHDDGEHHSDCYSCLWNHSFQSMDAESLSLRKIEVVVSKISFTSHRSISAKPASAQGRSPPLL